MLNVMRENLKSLKWLLWVVALSMVAYLGSFFFEYDQGGPAGAAWAARVGKKEIASQDFLLMTRGLDQQYRQMLGENYDQMRGQLQLGSQAVNTLIQRELILADARGMGIRVSPEDVARAIQEDPNLQDANGNFVGVEEYRTRLARFPGGVSAYEDARAEDLMVQRWDDLIGQAASVSEAEAEDLYRQRNERTTIDFVIVASADQEVDSTISDDEVRSWYDAHTDAYQRDERRRVRYVTVDRDALLAGISVGDDEVRAYYDANQDKYQRREQRTARHILLRVESGASDEDRAAVKAEAEGLLARAKAGEDFGAMAAEHSDDTASRERGGDLGWFGRGQMVPPFENAVFGTPKGEFAEVVETTFGYHVIQVTDERPEGVTPLTEVEAAIRRELALNQAQIQVDAQVAQLAQKITSAEDLASAAAGASLPVQELVLTRGANPPGLGASPEFMPAVFELAAGEVSGPLSVTAGRALVAVDEILPAGTAPLDEVETSVRTDILNQRTQDAAVAAAEAARQGSTDFARIAKELNLEIETSGELRPGQDLPLTGGLPAEARELFFGDAVLQGDIGVIPVPAGALLYEIKERQAFDPVAFEEAREDLLDELLSQRRNAIRQAMLDRLREQREIVINNEVVSRFDS